MSLAPPGSLQDRRPSPNLQLNLSSNNPFRQHTASPPKSGSTSPARNPTGPHQNLTGVSTNPFLDNYQAPSESAYPTADASSKPPPMLYDRSNRREAAVNAPGTAELLNGLVLTDKSPSDRKAQPLPRPVNGAEASEAANHRSTQSQDDQQKRMPLRDRRGDLRDPTLNPPQNGGPRPSLVKRLERKPIARRNSDTSVIEVKDEERKTRTRAEMDREAKSKDTKQRDPRYRRPHKSSKRVDLIDKLDVTGLYGTGMFHHDGPFDACNPHRNRRGARAAPMGAFAEGSANNSLGGSGPRNKQIDLDTFHGRGADAFQDYNDYSQGAEAYPGFRRGGALHVRRGPYRADEYIDDPKARTQFVLGSETAGLGTSTFLEGTPVPRAVLQRKESENEVPQTTAGGGGIQRKKSLAQKIRGGMSRQRQTDAAGNAISPEPRYLDPVTGRVISPSSPQYVQSAGGHARVNEVNPFFSELNPAAENPEQEIKVDTVNIQTKAVDADQDVFATVTRPRTASSPRRNRVTTPTNENTPPGGFLNRVKSLKGGRRTRPDRSGSASQAT